MDWAEALRLAGVAAAVALAAAAGAVAVVRGDRPWRIAAFVFACAFFLTLTQLPIPDPRAMHCPMPGTRPNLDALHLARRVLRRLQDGTLAWALVHDRGAASAVANLGLCGLIGWAGAPLVRRPLAFVALGAGASLLVELTQLTGTWGLFPCAYREFSVDDLILNTAGLGAGLLLGRRWARRSRVTGPDG